MSGMDSIFLRKSVRSYTGEPPTPEELDQILRACYAAPVGMGRFDSLHITVVRDRDYLQTSIITTAQFAKSKIA